MIEKIQTNIERLMERFVEKIQTKIERLIERLIEKIETKIERLIENVKKKIKKPKYFVAENVSGILTLGKGIVMQKIIKDFKFRSKKSVLTTFWFSKKI